uniref:Uncharacterized protein n=1 Tax=Arion vulgaris TaxID=1028688 RepID=A0A0B6ZS12_9EUPU
MVEKRRIEEVELKHLDGYVTVDWDVGKTNTGIGMTSIQITGQHMKVISIKDIY